jgi:16S rRNA (adenine1518-N6/adenine1519-N6)-dimethyltransferase
VTERPNRTSHDVGSAGPRLLGPADVRLLADAAGLRPSKQRGQNFVIDANTVRRIVRTADLSAEDVVVEVGPGLGSLTLGLLAAASRVVAVEVDASLAEALPGTVAQHAPAQADRIEVLHADAMRVEQIPGPPPTALVANLPYNVAVPVLLHLFALLPSLRHTLVMVQSEVADRLAAPPGSRTYGIPSAKAAWFADVRRAGHVSRSVFWPVPNVDSALVACVHRPPPHTTASRDEVFRVVDAVFAQRRKTMRSTLAPLAGSPVAAETALRAAGVDPGARGEVASIQDLARVAEALAAAP